MRIYQSNPHGCVLFTNLCAFKLNLLMLEGLSILMLLGGQENVSEKIFRSMKRIAKRRGE